MTLTLLNAREDELASGDLVFTRPQEAYDKFPEVLESMFEGQPLRQSPAAGVSAVPGTADAQSTANGVGGAPGTAAAQSTANGVGGVPGTAGAQSAANGVNAAPGGAAEDLRSDAWKRKVLFLNARIGVSNRYYLNDTADRPIFTVDGGLEGELHLFKFLALQFGVNYALDRAEYQSQGATSRVHSTSVLSIPVMLKFIFNPSTATTLGFFGGTYANHALLGPTEPPLFGVLAGIETAVKAGPGAILFDLRGSRDLGSTDVHDDPSISYDRMFFTFSVGYKFGFLTRKR
jgi:hypothetical protein